MTCIDVTITVQMNKEEVDCTGIKLLFIRIKSVVSLSSLQKVRIYIAIIRAKTKNNNKCSLKNQQMN